MDRQATKKRKLSKQPKDTSTAVPSSNPAAGISFFGNQAQTPIQVTLDAKTLLLLTALVEELKIQNDINLLKLKLIKNEKQAEIDHAEQLKLEDEERFTQIKNSIYS